MGNLPTVWSDGWGNFISYYLQVMIMAKIQEDSLSIEILEELKHKDLQTPQIRNRTTGNLDQVKYRLGNQMNHLVEVEDEVTPAHGGTETNIWTLSSEGEEFIEENELERTRTLEDLENDLDALSGEIEDLRQQVENQKNKIQQRPTTSVTEGIREEIGDIEDTLEFIEGRARQTAKEQSQKQKIEMIEKFEERIDNLKESDIQELKNAMLQLQDTQTSKDERINGLERRLEKKDERIETLESRLEEVENRTISDLLPF